MHKLGSRRLGLDPVLLRKIALVACAIDFRQVSESDRVDS